MASGEDYLEYVVSRRAARGRKEAEQRQGAEERTRMQARICLVGRAKEDLEGRGMHALGLKDCRKGEWNALGAWRSMPGTEKAAGCLARGARGVQRPKRL